MAAKNGPLKTIFYVIIFFVILCAVGLYLLLWAGKTSSSVHIDPQHTLHSGTTQFHDHRVDRWS